MAGYFPELSDGTIRIVPFGENHLTQRYVDWLNDKDVVRYSEQRHTKHTMDSVTQYYLSQKETKNHFLAIELSADPPLHIGNMRVFVNEDNNFASLSIIMGDKNYWGKGLATRAWNMALETLLGDMGFRLVVAGTMEVNIPMINLMKRCGMQIDCVLPKRFLWEGKEVGLAWASKSR